MKITRNQLKELVRQSIVEDWWSKLSSAEQSQYIKKHPGSKKAQQAKKKEKALSKGDVGGPSYPNVPKGAKTSKDAEKHAQWMPEPEPTSNEIPPDAKAARDASKKKIQPLKKGKPTSKTVKTLAKATWANSFPSPKIPKLPFPERTSLLP